MERVLVVDDEEGIRTFITEVLEGEGLDVTVAEDGARAAAILERQTFHLLVTDLKMPRMDGMALVRKARSEHPDMEVIVLTAHGSVGSAVEAMKLGAFDYLSKPLSGPDEMRLVVARALERRRLRDDGQRARSQDPARSDSSRAIPPWQRSSSRSGRWGPPMRPCWSSERAVRARRSSRVTSTSRAGAATGHSSR